MTRRLVILCLLLTLGIRAEAAVFDFNAIITADQEVPAPVGVPASAAGFASVSYDDVTKELSWDIAWQDLTGPAVGMHFHEGAAGTTGGVVVNVGSTSGLTSPSTGSSLISDEFATTLLAGDSYLNIHTEANAPGEIRGQVSTDLISLSAMIEVGQEVPAPTGTLDGAGGQAEFAYDPATNLLGWRIDWANLTGPAVGMHIHGPANPGDTAGVLVNLGGISGLDSPSIGSTTVSAETAEAILTGQTYINIHTDLNAAGEIRGQIVPEPSSSMCTVLAGLAAMSIFRTRRFIR